MNQSQEKEVYLEKFINMGYYLMVLDWVKIVNIAFIITHIYVETPIVISMRKAELNTPELILNEIDMLEV